MIFFTILLLIFIVWTLINLAFLPDLKTENDDSEESFVSILVPMRNEERNVENCINMLKKIAYKNIEFIIYDDQSTDRTHALLKHFVSSDSRFKIKQGVELKDHWVGKVHACYQLRRYATGDYLCFIDADVTLHPQTISYAVALAKKKNAALVTGFPRFYYTNMLDKLVIPMMHFVVYFHLPIFLANYTKSPFLSAANGAFMFFKEDVYDSIGGHEVVKSSLVEDVHIARKIKQSGHRVILANITNYVDCKMYETNKETWDGFSKNIFSGIGKSTTLAILLTFFYTSFYILPLLLFLYGVFTWQLPFILPYCLTVVHRAISDTISKTPIVYSLYMPASALVLLAILWRSAYLSFRGQSYKWKGRSYK